MQPHCFTLFQTAIGTCAIAWRGDVVTAVRLPDLTEARLRASVWSRDPNCEETREPPPAIRRIIEDIVALTRGERRELCYAKLDMDALGALDQRVYAVARAIPPGRTLTYGEVAREVGTGSDARAVGQALGRNPFPIIVPCHRVVAAQARAGGFSAPGGVTTKLRLLAIEGATLHSTPTLFDGDPHFAPALRAGA
jgi:methylated-DNA-[protein]-cysteine S-methyltransferase